MLSAAEGTVDVPWWRIPGWWVDRAERSVRAVAAPLIERWRGRRWLQRHLPLALFAVVVAWYFVVFASLIWRRHEYFGSFDYDLGMYDQGIWQLAHGRGFMTIRGMEVFGHHANFGYLLLVPFYWIGIGGPHFLDLLNTAAVVAVAIPLFALGRRHLGSSWAGLGLGIAYLFHFSPQWKIQETFHAESIAAPFLVGAWYFASVGKWRAYGACLGFALLWKEDVALVVALMGLAVAVAFRRPKIGLVTFAVGAVWFAVALTVVIPAFSEEGAVFDSLFGSLGASATEVVTGAVRDPGPLLDRLEENNAIGSFGDDSEPSGFVGLARPYGFIGLAAPHVALVGVPQHVVNFATVANFTWDLRWHYSFFPFLGILVASAHVVVRRRRSFVAFALIGVMLLGVFQTRGQGVGPWTTNHDVGWWPLVDNPTNDFIRDAIADIPDDAVVSTEYYIVPHLSHREGIYTFPNPWISSNYGVGGVPAPPDPSTIDVLLINEDRLGNPDHLALFERIVSSGEFEVVERYPDGLILLVRR